MRQNKFLFFFLSMLFCSLSIQAQKKFRPSLNLSGSDEELWNFGVLFGYYPEPSQDFIEGFSARLIVERNLLERLDVRIEPGIIFEKLLLDTPKITSSSEEQSSSEVQIPLLLKYRSNRAGNVNPFIVGGYQPSYRFDNQKLIHYIEMGFGFDFYLRKSKAAFHMRVNKNISETAASGIFIGLSVETRDGWKLYKQ
jgi:hypothetical protein